MIEHNNNLTLIRLWVLVFIDLSLKLIRESVWEIQRESKTKQKKLLLLFFLSQPSRSSSLPVDYLFIISSVRYIYMQPSVYYYTNFYFPFYNIFFSYRLVYSSIQLVIYRPKVTVTITTTTTNDVVSSNGLIQSQQQRST